MIEELKQLNQFVEHWEEAVIGTTLEGIIATWNSGAMQLYGYSSEDILGKHISVLTHSGTSENVIKAISNIKEGKYIPIYNAIHQQKHDNLIHVSVAIFPVKNDSENVVAAAIIVHDITEYKQAQDMIDALMKSSPVGIYILQRGFFQHVSQQFVDILGYSEQEMLRTESINYVYSEDRDKVRANAISALKSGYCKPYDYRILTKSGELKYIMETVVSISYKGEKATLGNFMDITELRNTQEKMRDTNEKLNLLVQKFEKQNQMNSILSEMRDLLQSCSTIKETVPIIISAITKLFPKTDGALFLLSPSRTDLESVAKWGDFPEDVEENVFAPDACWGLRRGRPHMALNANASPICSHVKNASNISYVCLPLTAKGDVLGLLHLRIGLSATEYEKQQLNTDLKDMTVNLSEFLSLAVANIKLSENLQSQSVRDSLSGLFNRRYMEETLQREIQRAIRKKSSVGVVMADIDYFKKFNDTYGHAAGDMCISNVGKLFQQKIRGSDVACRYGGEEFVLLFPDSSIEDTFKRAEMLRQAVKELQLVFQGQFIGSITISMGIAAFPNHGTKVDELLRTADTSLYKAKQEGRDRVVMNNNDTGVS
ncbi:MAG: diguanylate cyclase [Dehalococcoidales bacterium]|nr:diguanylate cyclase [Dehalococcoidales bacterium]